MKIFDRFGSMVQFSSTVHSVPRHVQLSRAQFERLFDMKTQLQVSCNRETIIKLCVLLNS